MADSNPLDRLQPFLLDRLTDDEPKNPRERPERKQFTSRRYRDSVLRDLSWLLNTKAHTPDDPIHEFAEVARSVLNYGMIDLSGTTWSSFSAADVKRLVRAAILDYEPRIVRHTLAVNVTQSDADAGHVISLEIRGEIKLLPLPEPIFVRTSLNLENGHYELQS